jgi:DNA polymerase III alpha subunit
VEALVLVGAFDRLGERRQLLWDLAEAFDIVQRPQPTLPLLDSPDEKAVLSPLSPERKLALTFRATGVTGGLHLTSAKREAFTKAGCTPYRESFHSLFLVVEGVLQKRGPTLTVMAQKASSL